MHHNGFSTEPAAARAEYHSISPFRCEDFEGMCGGMGEWGWRYIGYEKQKQENRNDSKVAKPVGGAMGVKDC